jgi:hypothetical protein
MTSPRTSHDRHSGPMNPVLDEIIETFVSALGPFADADVVATARRLPETLAAQQDDLRVIMQVLCRSGVRARPVLLTVVGDKLIVDGVQHGTRVWPRVQCSLNIDRRPLGGVRIAVRFGQQRLMLIQAMPVDEAPRLAWLFGDGQAGPRPTSLTDLESPHSRHPPIARLGSAATLYDDRISFPDGSSQALGPDVVARVLELPDSGTVLRSVSSMMRGPRSKPRHALIEGPGWSEVARAPDSAPESADAFVEIVNYMTRGEPPASLTRGSQ